MLWASTSSWFGFSCNPPSFVHAISNNTLATFVAITQGLCSNACHLWFLPSTSPGGEVCIV